MEKERIFEKMDNSNKKLLSFIKPKNGNWLDLNKVIDERKPGH